MEQVEYLPQVGTASECLGYGSHRPEPLRFVWHHILPQVCGGQTVQSNLVSLCDLCHYAIHVLLWQLANNKPLAHCSRKQLAIAKQGYESALATGTANKIPKESAG